MDTTLKEKIKAASCEDAIRMLDEYIAANPGDDDALTIRGLRYWSAGKRSKAINDYLEAIRINPESRAREALRAANEILDYYNKDLLNP